MTKLFAELKRRHIFRVAIAYAVTAWLLLQLAAIVLPTFAAPHWVLKVLIGVFVLCFPLAILLAWAFEVTPEGVRRTVPLEAEAARPAGHGRRVARVLNIGIIVVLAAAVGVLAWRLDMKSRNLPVTAATVASAGTAVAAATAVPAQSVAVLPFTNDSGDPKQQYFSDGLSEDLILALNQYPGLTVIGRESSFRFRDTTLGSRQIGEKLGVAHLLEGSVSRAGDEVRVRAELVDTRNGHLIWSDHYDRPYKNLFALQDDITKAVATALKAKLLDTTQSGAVVQTDRPPSGSLAAYNAYLEGNFYLKQQSGNSLHNAITAYRRAISLDPHYAAAYAQLSFAWAYLGRFSFTHVAEVQKAYAHAHAAAETAVRLEPNLAAGHLARGYDLWSRLKWREAEREFETALRLAPASSDAMRLLAASLMVLGRTSEASAQFEKAIAADPLDSRPYYDFSLALFGNGNTNAAIARIRHAITLVPTATWYHGILATYYAWKGDAKAALKAAKAEPTPNGRERALVMAYAAAGDRQRTEDALHRFIARYGDNNPYTVADVYAFLKQPKQAFAWLDRAWRMRDPTIQILLNDPFLLQYKDDPRFAAFCRKVGLPVPGSASAATSATMP